MSNITDLKGYKAKIIQDKTKVTLQDHAFVEENKEIYVALYDIQCNIDFGVTALEKLSDEFNRLLKVLEERRKAYDS